VLSVSVVEATAQPPRFKLVHLYHYGNKYGSGVQDLVPLPPRLLFFNESNRLWRTTGRRDGTAPSAGVHFDYELSEYDSFTVSGGFLFFTRHAGGPYGTPELWRTNGTRAGTLRLPATFVDNMTDVGGTLFFRSYVDDRYVIWKTDGSPAGTQAAIDMSPLVPSDFASAGGRLFFRAGTGSNDFGLYVSDGTTAGTYMLAASADVAGALPVVDFNGMAIVSTGDGLLRTDGTPAGTQRIVTLLGAGTPIPVDDRLFFTVRSFAGGTQLWVSDGTASGTRLVVDAGIKGFGAIFDALPLRGALLFITNSISGWALWRTDGTDVGTTRVANLDGYSGGGSTVEDTFYFPSGLQAPTQLWRTDGTTVGTVLLKDFSTVALGSFSAVGRTLFFTLGNGGVGRELWALKLRN
jgi:ELWxxDGT repeat protein